MLWVGFFERLMKAITKGNGNGRNSSRTGIFAFAGKLAMLLAATMVVSSAMAAGLLLVPATAASCSGSPTAIPTNPAGYSTYIVVFNNTTSADQCVARISDQANTINDKVVYHYNIINGIAVQVPDNQSDTLWAMGGVKYVEKDQPVQIMLNQSIPIIGANQVWAAGDTGQGVRIGIIDTGVDASHPDFQGKIIAWTDLVNGKSTPYDDNGHGTHVSSIAAGTGAASNGTYRGVAPGASLIEAKALDSDGMGNTSAIIEGIDWAVQNHAQVISLSLGSYEHVQALDDAVTSAINDGVVVVVAAGNEGPGAGSITSPGDDPAAITVGAVDKSDNLASFSSRGPNYDGSVKPDVVNIGVNVVAARASGTSLGTPVNQYYTSLSGTSMATPMTAGVVALLLQKNPYLTPAQVKTALTATALHMGNGTPNNNYGYGRVQAMAAFNYVSGNVSPTPTISPTPTTRPTSYNVSTTHRWASYNGVNSPIETFNVTPGTTVAQSVYYQNVGTTVDSYTVSVSGIPQNWYSLVLYGSSTVSPGAGRYANIMITPATRGVYSLTVTVTSNGNPLVSSSQTYTLHVGSSASPTPLPSPSPSPSPSPRPSVTPTPTPTPTPPSGSSTIKGLEYVDANLDGRYEANEARIPGVTMRLYSSGMQLIGQTVTDHNGYYQFTGLVPGIYTVGEVTPAGYRATSPVNVTITVSANTIYTQHFGEVPV